jgi:Holliday junction resolvasome RuvABC DNA-binding subunit
MGYNLAFQCADVWSLELIKGVSDTIAFELLDKRPAIIRAAQKVTPIEAIQKARGIGEKTGERLLTYLDLTERCEVQERFEVWRDRP